jgi:hypothetical protein
MPPEKEDPVQNFPQNLIQRILRTGLFLAVNILLSSTLLPFFIPPFRVYTPSELFEVLLWQSFGTVGWPMALLGIVISLPAGAELNSNFSLLLILIYPAIQILLLRAVIVRPRRGELILMHVLVTFSFAVVWYYVLRGVGFMAS